MARARKKPRLDFHMEYSQNHGHKYYVGTLQASKRFEVFLRLCSLSLRQCCPRFKNRYCGDSMSIEAWGAEPTSYRIPCGLRSIPHAKYECVMPHIP